jgi:hypothetical protein
MIGRPRGPAYSALEGDIHGEGNADRPEDKRWISPLLARAFSLNVWTLATVILLLLLLGQQYHGALHRQEHISIWTMSDTGLSIHSHLGRAVALGGSLTISDIARQARCITEA